MRVKNAKVESSLYVFTSLEALLARYMPNRKKKCFSYKISLCYLNVLNLLVNIFLPGKLILFPQQCLIPSLHAKALISNLRL